MPPRALASLAAATTLLALTAASSAGERSLLTLEPPPEPTGTGSTANDGTEPDLGRLIDPEWTLQLEPSFWYVSPSGKVKLPVSSGTGPGGFTTAGDSVRVERLNLDTPRFEPAGEAHLSGGRWRFTFSGSHFSLDRENTPADEAFRIGSVVVAPGDPLDVSFEITSVDVTVGYRVWGRDFCAQVFTECPPNATDSLLRLYVIGGARFTDVSFEVARDTAVRAAAGADQLFGEPILGARAEVELAEQFTLDLQLTGGGLPAGDTSSYSVDVMAGFHWRPHPNIGVQIGYRQLAYWLSDGDDEDEFEYNGRLAGLFAGVVFRF